jgi:hypothetical protein
MPSARKHKARVFNDRSYHTFESRSSVSTRSTCDEAIQFCALKEWMLRLARNGNLNLLF